MTQLQKNKIIQIGIGVWDFDKAVEKWESFLGIKPILGETEGYESAKTTLRGKPTQARIKQALFDIDNIEIEIISPVDEEPSAWRERMEKRGEGLHHLAFRTGDVNHTIDEYQDQGFELIQYGEWGGEAPGKYAYLDTDDDLKIMLELLEF